VERRLEKAGQRFAAAARLLETLSHKSVLARGFALVTKADGTVVRAAGDLSQGLSVRLAFADGEAPAVIGEMEGSSGPKRKPTKKGGPDGGDQGALF
jgi:exodeoxyribonuclease VII large subunit